MADNPIDSIPKYDRISVHAVLVREGDDAQALVRASGIVDPVAIPVMIGDQPPAGFGDIFTPNLTAILEPLGQPGTGAPQDPSAQHQSDQDQSAQDQSAQDQSDQNQSPDHQAAQRHQPLGRHAAAPPAASRPNTAVTAAKFATIALAPIRPRKV